MKRAFFIATVIMLAWQASLAQVSQLVATDDAGGSFPSSIGSLDFYDNGLYWTAYGGDCSGELTSSHASFAILGFRAPLFDAVVFAPEHYMAQGCAQEEAIGGAVRDDTFGFFKPRLAGPGHGEVVHLRRHLRMIPGPHSLIYGNHHPSEWHPLGVLSEVDKSGREIRKGVCDGAMSVSEKIFLPALFPA